MAAAQPIAHGLAALGGALVREDGVNPIDKNGSAPGSGSVCCRNRAYLDNSILADQRSQKLCAVGMTTLEPVVLGLASPV
jgi:hypothetical protein